MIKLLNPKNLPISVTAFGLLGFLLRLWTLSGGTDKENLHIPVPAAWIALWIVTALVPLLIIYITKPLADPVKYNLNFPASPVSAVGTLCGALAVSLAGVRSFSNSTDVLMLITGLLGMASGVVLLMAGYARLKGMRVNFLYHGIPCLFMALHIFNQCKQWSNVPHSSPFLFGFLCQICAMLAVYQLCAFDVDMGKRRASLFWSLMSVYFCLVALPTADNLIFCGCIAVWMLTNLCSLRPAKKRKPAAQEAPKPVQAHMSGSDVSIDEIKSWLDEE